MLLDFATRPTVAENDVEYWEERPLDGAWYRYEDSSSHQSSVHLRRPRVIRETPKGVWLDDYGVERFVLKNARKRWAYPTIELARESFLIRKRKQIGWLRAQLDHVTAVLAATEKHFG